MNALPKREEESVPCVVYNTFSSVQMKTVGHVRLSTLLPPSDLAICKIGPAAEIW